MPKEINTDRLLRAISLLTALRSAIKDAKEYNDLSDSHVTELHRTLATIEDSGIDVTEFRIPDSEMHPKIKSTVLGSMGGVTETTYSDEKYVRKSIFLTKLDGILNYLNYILKEPKRSVGFKQKE